MRIAVLTLAMSFLTPLTLTTVAQEHSAHHQGTDPVAAGNLPTEPGQGAFATIAEIGVLLEADPATDWSRVNINALREHLVDMDRVTLGSTVEMQKSGNAIQYKVMGDGRTAEAIRAMVPAHAVELAKSTDWTVEAEVTEDGATLTLSGASEHEVAKIAALGFYGVMATGAHHQEHHLLMAKGDGAH